MASRQSGSDASHMVIVNDSSQFVVWPSQRRLPPGWRHVGHTGTRAELTEYLKAMGVQTVAAPVPRPRAAVSTRPASSA